MSYLLQHFLINSAREFPEKAAIIFENKKITYRELDEITDKLAWVLHNNGVNRGDRVGIFVNKSIPSIIAAHGILKAGGVYIPLDPYAPPSRLAYIILNCGIKVLLTSTRKAVTISEMFPEDNPLDVILLTDEELEISKVIATRVVPWSNVIQLGKAAIPPYPVIDADLAYILYTSGSTGVPKGVMISHRTSLTFVNWAYDTFNVGPQDRFSSHAPLHFDLSIFDIFVSFKAGATLILVPEKLSTFPIRLADWIENNKISVWYSVPSVLSLLALHGKLSRHSFSNLRIILFAGEVFPVKYLRELMSWIPDAEYYNLYGPTETNVITFYRVPKLPPDRVKPIPIGKPCENMEVFALSEDGELVAQPGQEGILYARGHCLAYGYWGDLEKTNQSFLSNPLQPHFQERVYKTGDVVTMDENGNYLFLGRSDHMIKSRGYRIELGDIEACLYAHPKVKEAAALPIPDDIVGNRIGAFVVLTEPNGVSQDELRRFCAERIPDYMIPEEIDFRDSLPKTSTGKVDRPSLANAMRTN